MNNDDNPLSGKAWQTLITHRTNLVPGDEIIASRLSNTVYIGKEKQPCES